MTTYCVTTSTVAVVITIVIYCIIYIVPELVPATTPLLHSNLHCQHIRNVQKTTQEFSKRTMPPWSSMSTNKSLYVWPSNAGRFRLGNRLFNYAATFGIAWHNRHYPLLPYPWEKRQQYDLAKYFNLSTPVDHGNRIIQVTHC